MPSGQSVNKRLYLDLGDVQVMAKVLMNKKELGILWKLPYRIDITDAVQPGDNQLEIEIVNLWPNRQIGDESLPEDSERKTDGTLQEWPSWLQQGKESPAGRSTFTTWKLWRKDDPLLPSGMIGPVIIETVWNEP